MPTIEVQVRRFSVVSSRPFEEIVKRLTATIGHPDMNAFHSAVAAARTVVDLEEVVQGAIGSSDLMEFVRFDAGEVVRKERGGQGPKIVRLIVGNTLIMKEMAKTVPDAASYAPVTILVDERADGVHLSYDSMVSLISPYGSQAALVVARNLDAKIESLLKTARPPVTYRGCRSTDKSSWLKGVRVIPVSCTSSGSQLQHVQFGTGKFPRRHTLTGCWNERVDTPT